MATRTGLEPVTLGVTGRYSNQLNYRAVIWGDRLDSNQRILGSQPRVLNHLTTVTQPGGEGESRTPDLWVMNPSL